MGTRKIVQLGAPVLHAPAKRVHQINASLAPLLAEMRQTMLDHAGIGIAAPQVGVPLRIALVEWRGTRLTLINPEILRVSGEQQVQVEGCLSVPGFVGEVSRALEVKVRAQTIKGKRFDLVATGYLARILQHEQDHLDGFTYLDRLLPGSAPMTIAEAHARFPVEASAEPE